MKPILSSIILSISFFSFSLSAQSETQKTLGVHVKNMDLTSEIRLKTVLPMTELLLPEQVTITPSLAPSSLVALNLSTTTSQSDFDKLNSGVVIAVAATLKQGKGLADQIDFKSLEASSIRKHNGTVVVSASLVDSQDSPFDILEVIHFPNMESYEGLMNDEAYLPGKKLGDLMSKTYEKDVAIAQVKVSKSN